MQLHSCDVALALGVQVSLFDASNVQDSAPSFKHLKFVRRALTEVKAVIAVKIANVSDLNIVHNSRFDGHVYILPTSLGLPPMNLSSTMFRKTEATHGQQATEAGRDCHQVAAG